jgi:hypothetical protein
MCSQADPVAHPWRRYLRFSVRGLFVVVLAIGAALGWIVGQAHIQRDAVAVIEKAGGSVLYDWEWGDGNKIPGGKPSGPRWLVDQIGVDYFGHVTAVEFSMQPGATDSTLEEVGHLTRVEVLYANSPSVSDAGLAHLAGLRNLSTLDLAGTNVTDAGLAHLKGLTHLKRLYLRGTHVTDAGLVHLKGLTNLSSLYVNGSRVTDAGEHDIKQALPSLKIYP